MNPNLPSIEDIRAQMRAEMQPQEPGGVSGRGGLLTSLISEGGAAGGAAIGTAIAPGLGTILGAGLGGLFGRLGENKIRDDEFKLGSALGEAALSAGTASIAPIFRGAKAAKAASGTGDDVLRAFGGGFSTAPATGSVAATKLADQGDEVALKTFKLNRSQIQNIRKATGKDPSSIVRRFKLVGKTADDVQSQLDNLNKQFGRMIDDVGEITVGDVRKNIASQAQKYLSNPVPELRKVGQQILDEGDVLLSNIGDDATKIGARQWNTIKSDFDGLTNWKTIFNNPVLAGKQPINKALGDSIRETIRSKSGSGALKKLGVDIRDLSEFAEQAAKQADLGRGTNPIGLTDAIVAGGGATVGNIPGAIGAVGIKRAINSPLTQSALSRALSGSAGLVNKIPASATTFGTQLAGQLAARAPGQLMSGADQSLDQNSSISPTMAPNSSASINPSMADSISATGAPGQDDIFQQVQLLQAQTMLDALEAGASQSDLEQIQMLFPLLLQEAGIVLPQTTPRPELNNTATQAVTDLQTGLDNLGLLEERIASSSANAPFIGNLRSMNPFDTEAKSLRAEIDRVKQVIGKALEGGVLRKEDEEKYARILPTVGDTDEVAMAKIRSIRTDLQNKLNTFLYNASLYGGADDTGALIDQGAQ